MTSTVKHEQLFCTYLHLYDNEPLYVGQGSEERSHDFRHRSDDHKEFLKTKKVNVLIVGKHGDRTSARLNERGLISWLKPQFNKITRNIKRPDISIRLSGENNPMFGKTHSPETIDKIKANSGRPHTAASKAKIGDSNRGRKKPPRLDTSRYTEAALNREKKECPYCGMSYQPGTFSRWHGENCKMKP